MALMNLDFTDKEAMMSAINQAAEFVKKASAKKPEIGLVLGSGLGAFAEKLQDTVVIPYENIPFFPKATVEGHGGKLFLGSIAGKNVVVMQGRYHYYEGYDTQTITLPIRMMKTLGVDTVILTNACGGISKHFSPGDLMIIEDHIANFCPNPLRGANLDAFGERFIDMSHAYTPELITLAEGCAKKLNIKIQKGVYGYWPGPTYETAAEIRAYMALGADVVGMSTVAETIVARHCNMKVLGISCVTNMTCIISKAKTSHEEVVEMGKLGAEKFITLITDILKNL